MKIVNNLLIIILALMSIAAGAAKIMLAPQEVQFLQSFGMNNPVIIIFGVIQIIGGALLAHKRVRLYGAFIVALGLLASTALIFFSGNVTFGLFSLLSVVLAIFVIKQSAKLP
jgi:hypothetical protein